MGNLFCSLLVSPTIPTIKIIDPQNFLISWPLKLSNLMAIKIIDPQAL
jgi:hypothetical protein